MPLLPLLCWLGFLSAGFFRALKRRVTKQSLSTKNSPIGIWLGGLAVLMIGLFFLADPMRAPIDTKYAPATLKDGAIEPGQFNPDLSEDEKDD